MSKHHHHPDEGHGGGDSPGSAGKPLHHNVFFWVAGFFILLALIGFILEGIPAVRSSIWPAQTTTSAVGEK
jgi:hypothetical protein